MLTSIQGFPRIGERRELKFALEAFWRGESSETELVETGRGLRRANYRFLREAGLELVPVGDFSWYDRVLDTALMVDAIPARFAPLAGTNGLALHFALARGAVTARGDLHPLSMLKWFNTNYHYLVPELERGMHFSFRDRSLPALVDEALEQGVPAMPVLLGPVSFLLLSRGEEGLNPLSLLEPLLEVYARVIRELAARQVRWIQLDEPWFATSAGPEARQALECAYGALARAAGDSRLVVQTYFDHVGENYRTLTELPVAGLGLDFISGPENLDFLRQHGFPKDKTLFAGVIDGRNIWAVDPDQALRLVAELERALLGGNRPVLSSSCSLMHVPVSAESESHLPQEVRESLAFAREKVRELVALAREVEGRADGEQRALLERKRRAVEIRQASPLKRVPAVRRRLTDLAAEDFSRGAPYPERRQRQAKELALPPLPTTTIGSFPQTAEVRRLRTALRRGELGREEYREAMRALIREVIALQAGLGLDVLVHGEFERTDMVEYFGEQLEGFFFLRNGWVLSYGSRCVKPPVIYGDVSRPRPMTVEWLEYAQQLSPDRPVKGMLTGPVTILNWSFVRDDLPRREVCFQLALAVRDEVRDLERAGLRVIQIDEPALREGLPLQREQQPEYLRWAVDAFRLTAAGASAATQVHSHMCYSDFNTIIGDIGRMDADVISIENSRGGSHLLEIFREHRYPNGIGPGIWDIHSPLVPEQRELERHLREILEVLEPEQVWVNPDCGLKTRAWEEVHPALANMVGAARALRLELEKRGRSGE